MGFVASEALGEIRGPLAFRLETTPHGWDDRRRTQYLMFDYRLPKQRKAGRRAQLSKFHRKRAQWLPKSELLIASLRYETAQGGW